MKDVLNGILFCIALTALIIACLAFTKESDTGHKTQYYNNCEYYSRRKRRRRRGVGNSYGSPNPSPTHTPHGTPTHTPHGTPTHTPHGTPTHTPHGTPTHTPHGTPTHTPHGTPTHTPHGTPTHTPHGTPTHTPHGTPTHTPHGTPTHTPHGTPTHTPHGTPTHTLIHTPIPLPRGETDWIMAKRAAKKEMRILRQLGKKLGYTTHPSPHHHTTTHPTHPTGSAQKVGQVAAEALLQDLPNL